MHDKTPPPALPALRKNPLLVMGAVAAVLTLLRYSIATSFDLDLLLNEEASIYLHAAEKSFLELFLMPDSNYINFINKFCAFVTLRVFKLIDSFALAQNVVNWFAGALFSTFFLSQRFAVLVPSFRVRLLLITYCFLLPILDMHMVFGQGYYVFFALCWYALLLYDTAPITRQEKWCLLLTAPFAVFSKPVYFVFGFAFLAVFLRGIHRRRSGTASQGTRSKLCAYLLALYAFQAWFTLSQRYMEAYAFAPDTGAGLWPLLLFLAQKGVIILGYGLVCPLAHCLPGTFATPLCFAAGLAVLACLAVNLATAARKRDIPRLGLLLLLAASSALAFYGALFVDFLYQRFFLQDIFAVQWSHRMVFPVILLALFNFVFFCQRYGARGERSCVLAVCGLGLLAFAIPSWNSWRTGYAPSFTWTETRPLLDETYAFIPYAHGMQFYYLRGLTFVSPELPVERTGGDGFVVRDLPPDRKIKYFMLRQTPGTDAMALPPGTTLRVRGDGVDFQGELVNPGMRSWYLFRFAAFVPSEAFARCALVAPPGLSLSLSLSPPYRFSDRISGGVLKAYLVGF